MLKLQKTKCLLLLLLIAWMTIIFCMSAQPSDESSQLSGGMVSKIVAVIYPNFNSLSVSQQLKITDLLSFIVRKTAHFSEYFVLGALVCSFANTYKKYKIAIHGILSVVFCLLYAVSDEIHQYFVPGRACRFLDICIDTAGSVIAVFLFSLIAHRKMCNRSGE